MDDKQLTEAEIVGISNSIYLAGAGGAPFDGAAAIKTLIATTSAQAEAAGRLNLLKELREFATTHSSQATTEHAWSLLLAATAERSTDGKSNR